MWKHYKGAGGMAQVVPCQLGKHKAGSSNTSIAKKYN
jgi:hypothetical protein